MSITLLPKTKLGKWSVGLLVLCLLSHYLSTLNFPFVGLAVTTILALSGITLGIVSIIKNSERAVLTYFSVAVCIFTLLFPIVFVLGEGLFPH